MLNQQKQQQQGQCCLAVARANEEAKLHYTSVITNENEVRLERPSSYRKKGTTRVLEQGKKAKPKATLHRTGSGQPSRIEDLEHERVRKIIQYVYNGAIDRYCFDDRY
ncbi:Hypothetical_protein [Hexamita inflata]|uniref:Hypothetical_protein n=1 Tax=Hexamita inflata TaxID=28002 RepID=A0ABP1HYJ0_9EUKA